MILYLWVGSIRYPQAKLPTFLAVAFCAPWYGCNYFAWYILLGMFSCQRYSFTGEVRRPQAFRFHFVFH